MSWLYDVAILFLRGLLFKKAVQRAKRKGVLVYLKTLLIIRQSLAAGILFFLFLQTMMLGFVGCLCVGVWLCPLDLQSKIWVLLGIFAFLFLIPLCCLFFLFSNYVWFQLSGAQKLANETLEN